MYEKFSDYKIEIPYGRRTGNVKCYCPKCHDQRTDKRDKSLSVNIDKGVWHCHNMSYHCARQFSGIIRKLVEKHLNQKEENK